MKNSNRKDTQQETLHSIELRIADRLKDRNFRREWFRAELESTVPQLFRSLRKKRSLTQAQLAEITKIKQSSISRFESSTDAVWKFTTLQAMAEAMDSRLYINLEPAEDVIDRVEREERLVEIDRPSAADRSAEDGKDHNKISNSALNYKAPKLEELKGVPKGEKWPWN